MGFNDRARREEGELWDEPEVGTYRVKVIDADCFVSKSGNEIGKASLLVLKGEHEGKQFDHILNFGNDVGFGRSKTALVMYGLKWEPIHDAADPWATLKASIAKIVGVEAEVSVAKNNGYTNIDVVRSFFEDRSLEERAEEFVHSGAADDDDEELPY
jgi:hypothetical protein